MTSVTTTEWDDVDAWGNKGRLGHLSAAELCPGLVGEPQHCLALDGDLEHHMGSMAVEVGVASFDSRRSCIH